MNIIFDNFSIRDISISDLNSIVKYANNYNVSRFLRDAFPFPYTEKDAEKWIEFIQKNNSHLI